MFYFVIVIIGMCLASFINVVVYRLPRNEDFIFGRSYCPSCHHELNFLDMIPVISYLTLKGHCRYCHSYIHIRDTLIELLGGAVALLCYYIYGASFMFIISFVLALVFMTISLLDCDTMMVDNRFQFILLIIAMISMFFNDISFPDRVIGCLCMVLPFYFLNLYKECIGGADLKLMAIMGWMLGAYHAIIGLSISVIMASLYSLVMLMLHKVTKKSYIPFIPFLCIGFFISLLYYHEISSIYFYW